ncbi:MAG: hypothetical protein GY696_28540 [Gammaproteobacteria bacterium]|nr:hypothetical protein [Gammaproteobacteria bacterium]
MATFYGLLSWLTHTVFAVQLVFIPSGQKEVLPNPSLMNGNIILVLASIFAAIPFFGTYFAAFPAVLELWLIRGEPFQAVLLFLMHFIPGYFVDDVIFSEIKYVSKFSIPSWPGGTVV